MAVPEDKDKSDVEVAIERIETAAKVGAYEALKVVAGVAGLVSVGATTVKKAATKAREGLLK